MPSKAGTGRDFCVLGDVEGSRLVKWLPNPEVEQNFASGQSRLALYYKSCCFIVLGVGVRKAASKR